MTIAEYVELEFMMTFYEMYFPDTWNDNKLPKILLNYSSYLCR
jgi:hypothetical protein